MRLSPTCLWLAVGLSVALFPPLSQARASDYRNDKRSEFVGVTRVFVIVHYVNGLDKKSPIPESLLRENLEKMMVDIYTRRYSKRDCGTFKTGWNAYGCNDQPVTLVPIQDGPAVMAWQDSSVAATDELTGDGTLLAILSVGIHGNMRGVYDPPLQTPVVTCSIVYARPGLPAPRGTQVPGVMVVPASQPSAWIHDRMEEFVKASIF